MKLRIAYLDVVELNFPHTVIDEVVKRYELKTIEECSKKVRDIIETNCLGASDFMGSEVYADEGILLGEIVYNGKFIPKNKMERTFKLGD